MKDDPSALQHWLPGQLATAGGQLLCRWLYTAGKPFTEPFFAETIARCLHLPQNSQPYRAVSSPDMLMEWANDLPMVKPAAFIFHISRCGSTLLSQLLSLDPQNTVLSEVPFFDEALRLPFGSTAYSEEEAAQLFTSALKFYTVPDGRSFIKTDSWHIFFYPLLRRLFPETSFVLLYREPAAVLRSQQKKRGMHAVPGVVQPALFGWTPEEIAGLSLDDYLAKVMERYFETFLRIAQSDGNILLCNYSEGLLSITHKLYEFLSVQIPDDIKSEMEERSRYHAKYPGEMFSESAALPPVTESWAKTHDLYNQLEAVRCAASSLATT